MKSTDKRISNNASIEGLPLRGERCIDEEYSQTLHILCSICPFEQRKINYITQGFTCKQCKTDKKVFFFNQVLKIVKKHKGSCIQLRGNAKIQLTCKNGHTWTNSTKGFLEHKYWCEKCEHKKRFKIIEEIMINQNAMCLSSHYKGYESKHMVSCKEGHVFHISYDCLLRGHWCPSCTNNYTNEKTCRRIFETIFKKEFSSIMHPQIRNTKTNRKLQLDGFNDELMIAFERQGEQHYFPKPKFNKRNSLEEIQQKDAIKKERCKEIGIDLIIIPYYIRPKYLKEYIIKELIQRKHIENGDEYYETQIYILGNGKNKEKQFATRY